MNKNIPDIQMIKLLQQEVKKLEKERDVLQKELEVQHTVKEDLSEGVKRLSLLASATLEATIVSRDGKIIDANERFLKEFGYKREELIELTGLDLVFRGDFEKVIKTINTKEDRVYEIRCMRKNGEVFQAEVFGSNVNFDGKDYRVSAVRDMTKRLETEHSLTEARKRLSLVINNVPAIILAKDANGVISLANSQASKYLQTPVDQLIGMNLSDVVKQKPALKLITDSDKELQDSKENSIEFHRPIPNPISGKEEYIEVAKVKLEIGEEEGPHVLVVASNVTEKVLMEQKLREALALEKSEGKFKEFLDKVHMVGVGLDDKARITYLNDFTLQITGYSREEIFGKDWFTVFVPKKERKERRDRFKNLLIQKKQALYSDTKIFDKAGNQLIIRWSHTYLEGEGNKNIAVLGVGENLTEELKVKQHLERSEQMYRSLVNSLAEGIVIADKDRKILYASDQIQEVTGYKVEDLLGKKTDSLVVQEEKDHLERMSKRRLKGQNDTYDMKIRKPNGTDAWLEIKASPYRDESGTIVGSIAALSDITAQRSIEQRMELVHSLALESSTSSNLSQALTAVLKGICEFDDWDYGEAWLPETGSKILERSNAWYSKDKKLHKFHLLSIGFRYEKGHGVTGKTYVKKQPSWVPDISKLKQLSRRDLVIKYGLISMVSVPVIVDKEVVAILNFFGKTVREKDELTLQLAETLSSQMGALFMQKRSEEVMHRSEQQYRELFDSASEMIFILGTDGTVNYANSSWHDTLKYKKNVLGKINIKNVLSPDCKEKCNQIFADVLKGESFEDIDLEFIDQSGKIIQVEGAVSLTEVEDSPSFIRGIFRDVTERNYADQFREAAHLVSYKAYDFIEMDDFFSFIYEELFMLLEMPRFIIAMDNDEGALEIVYHIHRDIPQNKLMPSDKWLLSLLKDQTSKKAELITGNRLNKYRSKNLPRSQAMSIPLFYKRKRFGSLMVIHGSKNEAYTEKDLTLIEFFASQVSNVIHRKRVELQAVQNRSRLRAIVEGGRQKVCSITREGVLIGYNNNFHTLMQSLKFKDLKEGILWKSIAPYISNEAFDAIQNGLDLSLAGKFVQFEVSIPGSEEIRWYEVFINPVKIDEEINEVSLTLHNITEKKTSEQALIKAKELAEASSRQKTEFLANMSHELRTPMTGVLGMTDLLQQTSLDGEQKEYAKTIRESASHLLQLINDLLDFSTLQSAELKLNPEKVEVDELINQLMLAFKAQARQKKLELSAELDQNVPSFVKVDELRLYQILSNLIANAMKFTHKGSVKMKIAYSDKGVMRFEIKDTGVGIPKQLHSKVFEQFNQGEMVVSKRYSGAGLGLAICKELVARMGGEIGFTSKVNKGSNFWVELPVKSMKGKKTKIAPVSEIYIKGNLLIIEDDPVNRQVIGQMLKRMGMSVTKASSANAARRILKKETPDLILMDLHMPEESGFDFIRKYHKRKGKKAPVIVLSANALPETRDQLKELGAIDFLVKPVDSKQLAESISKVLVNGKTSNKSNSAISNIPDELKELLGSEFDSILKEFCEQSEALLKEAKSKLYSKDKKALMELAHRLKGSSASLGLNDIATKSAELEADARASRLNRMEAKINDLELLLTDLSSAIK